MRVSCYKERGKVRLKVIAEPTAKSLPAVPQEILAPASSLIQIGSPVAPIEPPVHSFVYDPAIDDYAGLEYKEEYWDDETEEKDLFGNYGDGSECPNCEMRFCPCSPDKEGIVEFMAKQRAAGYPPFSVL